MENQLDQLVNFGLLIYFDDVLLCAKYLEKLIEILQKILKLLIAAEVK